MNLPIVVVDDQRGYSAEVTRVDVRVWMPRGADRIEHKFGDCFEVLLGHITLGLSLGRSIRLPIANLNARSWLTPFT